MLCCAEFGGATKYCVTSLYFVALRFCLGTDCWALINFVGSLLDGLNVMRDCFRDYFFVLSVFFLFFWCGQASAQDRHTQLQVLPDWEVYDAAEAVSVPYIQGYHRGYRLFFQDLNLRSYAGFYLRFVGHSAGSIFWDDKLIYAKLSAGDTVLLPVSAFLLPSDAQSGRISFYGKFPGQLMLPPVLSIVGLQADFLPADKAQEKPKLQKRERQISSGWLFYLLFLWFFFASYLYFLDHNFSPLLFVTSWFLKHPSSPHRQEISVAKLIAFALLYSFILTFFVSFAPVPNSYHTALLVRTESQGVVGEFILFALLFFTWLSVRYLMLWFLAFLAQNTLITSVYLEEWYRLSVSYAFIVLVLSTGMYLNRWYLYENIASLLWVSLLLKAVFLVFRINRSIKFQKIHLFLYLCTSEFIPILLGMKFFTNF